MERAVITGGTGMIGRALTELLVRRGVQVLLMVNPASQRLSGIPESDAVTVVPCDIADIAGLRPADGQPSDVFYHLAWAGTFGLSRDDVRSQEANIRFALDAVQAAENLGCRRFVGAGSQAEYGRVEGSLSPDTPARPESGYGIAKLAAGGLTRLLCSQKGIDHLWARILSVYGPDDGTGTMVMSTIGALLAGGVPQLTPCEQQWDYLYRDDCARALYLIGEKGRAGAVYPVGSGNAVPLRRYVEAIRDAVDPDLPLGIGALPYGKNQVMHLHADIGTLVHDTGFAPQVSFEEGAARTVAWVKQQENGPSAV